MTVVHIRITRWMFIGLVVLPAVSRGDEIPPPAPTGGALPRTPTTEQVLHAHVDQAQAPAALAPSVRGFKISENQSPQPQDRFFYTFNYYYNLNSAVDRRFDTPINDLRAYREILGFEKTFDQGRASIGLRMPIDTLFAK